MEHYLKPIVEYFNHHQIMGVLAAFIVAFIESLPLLGTLFPGAVTMTALGGLVGASILPPVATIIFAILGAFSGDCIGFWLGSRYHAKIRSVWPINKFSKYLAYSEKFFTRHGGKSIIIGRFIGPTRAAMPLIAGLLRYKWKQFLPAAIFAAILWSLIYMSPGILLGMLSLELSHEQMTKVFLGGLAVIVMLWLIFWLLQYFFQQLSHFVNRQLQTAWNGLSQSKAKFFVSLIRNQQRWRDYNQLKLAMLFLISSSLFLLISLNIHHYGFLLQVNRPLFSLAQSFRNPIIDKFCNLINILGSPATLLCAVLLVGLGLAIYKQWRTCTHFILLGLLSTNVLLLVPEIASSVRPLELGVDDQTLGFPSKYLIINVAVLGFFAFLTTRIISRKWRRLIYLFFGLLIFLSSVSQLFLGQNWLTDILGGGLLGLNVLLVITLSYRRMPQISSRLKIKTSNWFALCLFSMLTPWIVLSWLHFSQMSDNTKQAWPTDSIEFKQWRQHPDQLAPLYRPDRFGGIAEPFNLQWAGNLDDIKAFLLRLGWESPAKHSRAYSMLQRFTSREPEFNTPLLQRLYQNKPPVIFFIKHLQNSPDILELRLWDSGIKFTDSPWPLWLGTIIYHVAPEKLLRFSNQYIHPQSGNILMDAEPQPSEFTFQTVHALLAILQPDLPRKLQWDGSVFVVYPKEK